jgi:hypothetical protein
LKSAFSTPEAAVGSSLAKIDMGNSAVSEVTRLIESEDNVQRHKESSILVRSCVEAAS